MKACPAPTTRRGQERRAAADPGRCTPRHWPFGALTETQIRARTRFEAAMRAGRLAALPGARL